MKSRQETTSLGQIATVTAKPTISDKHLYTLTREVLTFRRVTWDPPGQGLLYGGRHKLIPHHTNFCKFSQLCATLSSLAKDVSLSKLAILLILRRSFQWCRWDFANWSIHKKLKKREKVYLLCVTSVHIWSTDTLTSTYHTRLLLVFSRISIISTYLENSSPAREDLKLYKRSNHC